MDYTPTIGNGLPPLGTSSPPCQAVNGQCTDLYVVAHEDDDLLFMNPDIANSVEAGNHVVVIHLTAGDVSAAGASHMADHPDAQQYWMDRERGSINAFTFMAQDEAYTAYVPGAAVSSLWSASELEIAGVQMAEYDLVDDAQPISLVFLRLSDTQLEDAWLGKPGRGGRTQPPQPLAPGSVQTVACVGCPLGTDLPRQVITRDQLTQVLTGLITHFAGTSTSVSFQDASGLYIDALGTPAPCNPHGHDHGESCGYRDYWDHVYGAKFALAAALAAQADQAAPIDLREYRDYSISQEPATLSTCPHRHPWCDSDTTTKTQIMAYYALYDDGLVDHGASGFSVTEPSFAKAEAALKHRHYDPIANTPATFDDYDANAPRGWESRQVELQSLNTTARHGRLTANGACLGVVGDGVLPVDCTNAPIWQLTTTGQIVAADGTRCLTVSGSAVALGPCAPASAATTMMLFDTGQIRTADAGCLSMTATLANVTCTNPRDTDPAEHPHAEGVPVDDQDWSIIAP